MHHATTIHINRAGINHRAGEHPSRSTRAFTGVNEVISGRQARHCRRVNPVITPFQGDTRGVVVNIPAFHTRRHLGAVGGLSVGVLRIGVAESAGPHYRVLHANHGVFRARSAWGKQRPLPHCAAVGTAVHNEFFLPIRVIRKHHIVRAVRPKESGGSPGAVRKLSRFLLSAPVIAVAPDDARLGGGGIGAQHIDAVAGNNAYPLRTCGNGVVDALCG